MFIMLITGNIVKHIIEHYHQGADNTLKLFTLGKITHLIIMIFSLKCFVLLDYIKYSSQYYNINLIVACVHY